MSATIEGLIDSAEAVAKRLFVQNWRPGMKDMQALQIECVESAAEFVSCLSAFRSQMLKEHAEKEEVLE